MTDQPGKDLVRCYLGTRPANSATRGGGRRIGSWQRYGRTSLGNANSQSLELANKLLKPEEAWPSSAGSLVLELLIGFPEC